MAFTPAPYPPALTEEQIDKTLALRIKNGWVYPQRGPDELAASRERIRLATRLRQWLREMNVAPTHEQAMRWMRKRKIQAKQLDQ